MKKVLIIFFCLLQSSLLNAQITIASGTPVNGGSEAIITTGTSIVNYSDGVSFSILQLQENSLITTHQDLTISEGLILRSGKIDFTGSGKVLYAGLAENILYDDTNYVTNGFYTIGPGQKLFPIGTVNELADISIDISSNDLSIVNSVSVYNENIMINEELIPAGVEEISTDWYWQLHSEGEMQSALPSLSVNSADHLLLNNSGENHALVVLEIDDEKDVVNNLGRGSSSTDEQITASKAGIGPYFLLGTTKDIELIINQIITPDDDGVNDELEIQNLEVFAGMYEVMLVDRLGALVWSSSRLHEGNVDFSFLEPGNYVCIVNYAGNTAKQMVTVLK